MDKQKTRRFETLSRPGWTKLSSFWFDAKFDRFLTPLRTSLAAALLLIFVVGCGTIRKVEIEHRTETHYVDSTTWHVDTAYIDIPREVYRDYTALLDTLRLETGVARSWAAVDTTNMVLKGEIVNKEATLGKEILWKERVVYRDSLVKVDVPVEVEVVKEKVPSWSWWSAGLNILGLVLLSILIWMKIK